MYASGVTLKDPITVSFFRSQPTIVHWIYGAILMAIAHVFAICLDNYWIILFACVLQGTMLGLFVSQNAVIIHEAAGQSRYLQALTVNNVVYGVGAITSPFIGGNYILPLLNRI